MLEAKPEHLIGDRAYDSDGLDDDLRQDGVNMIAPNHSPRKLKTQDGRQLRRYERRWLVERFFAWLPDWQFTELGIDKDPVHVHMVIPPTSSVTVAVEMIKKNTSRRLREKFRFLATVWWDRGRLWSTGYVVSTVGISEEIIRRYVARQGQEDAGQPQLEF